MARGLKDSEILKETVMKQVTFLHLLSLVSALLLKHKNAQWSFAILSKNRGDRLFCFFFSFPIFRVSQLTPTGATFLVLKGLQ